MDIKTKIKSLPTSSGVYFYKDSSGVVIYIGKAVNIRKRVESYFRRDTGSRKTDFLVKNIVNVDIIQTASEAEALLLEASLVKQYQPKYNVELKDGKTYPYIQITKEEFPLVSVIRFNARDKKDINAELFGPYVNPTLIREALQIIRKIFPFRTCDPYAKKLCLYYDLELCQGPCESKISKEDYHRNIRNIKFILEGKKDDLYRHLHLEMESMARRKEFEGAARLRDQIRAIGALYSGTGDINYFKEAEQLQRAIGLERAPVRIECFDISNIMGNQSVGSMVSFLNGKPDKNNYRRFRIKTVRGIDDFQMIAEIVRRRYTRLQKESSTFPDLVVIDGGKGQLAAAMKELKKLNLSLPIVSLAKREEEIFTPGKRNSLKLPHDSLGLKLLMRVRDEAHRFGLKYHTLLRAKKFLPLAILLIFLFGRSSFADTPQTSLAASNDLYLSPLEKEEIRKLEHPAYYPYIDDVSKSIQDNPNDARAYVFRSELYARKGHYDLAIADCNKALGLKPIYGDAHLRRGEAYLNEGKIDLAILDFDDAIQIHHTNASEYTQRCRAYLQKGNWDQAISDCKTALLINPRDRLTEYAYFYLGNANFRKNRFNEAIFDYTRSLEHHPNWAGSLYALGLCYYRKGDNDQAIDFYNKALAFYPQNTDAQSARNSALKEKGKNSFFKSYWWLIWGGLLIIGICRSGEEKRFWKRYFWLVSFLLILPEIYSFHRYSDWITTADLMISAPSLICLYLYAYDKEVLTVKFWRLYLVLLICWDFCLHQMLEIKFHYEIFLISDFLKGLAVIFPIYLAVFLYAFKDRVSSPHDPS